VLGFIDILSQSAPSITDRKVEILTVGANYGWKGADFLSVIIGVGDGIATFL
jgi:hypothetical protein